MSSRRRGAKRFAILKIFVGELVYINDEYAVRSRQLNQTQTREIRIEIGGFRIDTDGRPA